MCNCCGNCGYTKEKIHGIYCLLEQGYVEPSSVCLSHKYKSTKNKEDKE